VLVAGLVGAAVLFALAAGLAFWRRSGQQLDWATRLLWIAPCLGAACYMGWVMSARPRVGRAAISGIITATLLVALPWFGLPVIARQRIQLAIEQENAEVARLPQNTTELFPDNKPSPASICPIGYGISMGGNFFGGVEFPFVALSIHDKPIIVLDMTPKGLVASFDVLDNDGTVLARVQRNVVAVYARGRINHRRSLHRLTMSDERGAPVLEMEYLNQTAIRIHGKFFIAPHIYILMDEDGTHEIDNRTNQELISVSRYIGCDVDVGLSL